MAWRTVDDPDWGELIEYQGQLGRLAVSAHGGQVLSWVCGNEEQLFVGSQARATAGKPLRGGIPIIFPQFSDRGNGIRHGFARIVQWNVVDFSCTSTHARIQLELQSDDNTLAFWPHRFLLRHSISITRRSLRSELEVTNTDTREFQFAAALHSYWLIRDARDVRLLGLENFPFLDQATTHRCADSGASPDFSHEVERLYLDCAAPVTICEQHAVLLTNAGWSDWVVWNPGPSLATSMSDLAPNDERHFVCVEAAMLDPRQLLPGHGLISVHQAEVLEAAGAPTAKDA